MSPDSLNRTLAANIKRHRRAQGWSQEELAERCGVHRTYIGSVERGERNVTLQTLEKIAGAMGVDAISLLRPSRR